jgi:hypothetical protein
MQDKIGGFAVGLHRVIVGADDAAEWISLRNGHRTPVSAAELIVPMVIDAIIIAADHRTSGQDRPTQIDPF